MCLIAFAYKVHPEYPLILLANRDEFYRRPTREAQFWMEEGHPEILSGKDLEAGGTWMGITKKGRWAALTNHRDLTRLKPNPPSRGNIVLDFLKSGSNALDYLAGLRKEAAAYNGFNLLLGDSDGIWHYANVTDKITVVVPGIHGVSNALLDTPWPKLQIAKTRLGQAIQKNNFDSDPLFGILANEKMAEEKQLPQTGLPSERERALSSIFIRTKDYGTRCSTLLYINADGRACFIERVFASFDKKIMGTNTFQL